MSVRKLSQSCDTIIRRVKHLISGVDMTSEHISQAQAQASDEQPALMMKQLFISLLACTIMLFLMQSAYATNSPMGEVLCNIVQIVYGNLGRGLASLAVIIIGVGATLGKTSWGLAMTVAVGIAVIFNGHVIVGFLINTPGFTCV
jgi:type IV secretory pathway VirB2 component (pilin)